MKIEKIATLMLNIVVVFYATYSTFCVGRLKAAQIKNLENQSDFWKNRATILKDNIDRKSFRFLFESRGFCLHVP